MKRIDIESWVFFLSLLVPTPAYGDIVVFDETTDTISIDAFPNMGNAATIECVIKFDPSSSGIGMIYNQWRSFQEDKQLKFDPATNQISGYLNIGSPVFGGGPVGLNEWRHLAYVYDGSEERLYVDGQLVASQSSSGDIPDGTSNRRTVIGAIDRSVAPPDPFVNTFIGEMDSLRISSVARYSGAAFSPHRGDFSLDSNALLIFNFTETPGSNSVTDLVSGAIGTFGVGFDGATSPLIVSSVPEPNSAFVLTAIFAGFSIKTQRRKFQTQGI
ncbi:MAG: LamG-like jellyroll fold domain-containing protein [Pirellulaceae bacterium]